MKSDKLALVEGKILNLMFLDRNIPVLPIEVWLRVTHNQRQKTLKVASVSLFRHILKTKSWLECGSSLLSSRMWPGILRDASVSVVVVEIVMQNIEEQALATYTRTIPLWLRYVDDTFTAVHKDGIDDFHEHLNRQNADIQFTKEIEENGKIPFLDCLVTHDNNKLQTTIYRKPTHIDWLLDQSSYNPTSQKATTIPTLTRQAQLVCDSPESLQDETDDLNNVFSKNNYNTDFVRWDTHSNIDSNTQTNVNSGPVMTALLYRTSEAPLKLTLGRPKAGNS